MSGVLKGVSQEIGKTIDEAKKQIAPGEFVKEGVEQLTGKRPKSQVGDQQKDEGEQTSLLKRKEEEKRQIAYWRAVLEQEKKARQESQEKAALRRQGEIKKEKEKERKKIAPFTPIRIGQGPQIVRGPAGKFQRGFPAALEKKKKRAEIKGGKF